MRILLIDDEVRKAQALISYFQEVCRWRVDIASGPDVALELLRRKQNSNYGVIILDVMMEPGKEIPHDRSDHGRDTGLILLELITELTGGRVSIILYTARTDLDYLRTEGRVADYIQKPRSAREVANTIRRFVVAT